MKNNKKSERELYNNGLPKLCYGYETDHPCFKGEPSTTCKGCTNRKVINECVPSYVFPDGGINCFNYLQSVHS